MKRFLLFVLITLFTVIAGCIFSDDDKKEEKKDESESYSAAKYYPLKVGIFWIYKATVIDERGEEFIYTDTYEITETITLNNNLYYVEKREIGGYGNFLVYLRISSNILYGINQEEGNEEKSYLNFNLSIGESWTPTGTLIPETLDGIVDVKVPVGIFKNCLKFLATGTAQEGEIQIKTMVKEYYAPEVGRVKSVLTKTDINGNVLFSEICDLTSYFIPE